MKKEKRATSGIINHRQDLHKSHRNIDLYAIENVHSTAPAPYISKFPYIYPMECMSSLTRNIDLVSHYPLTHLRKMELNNVHATC